MKEHWQGVSPHDNLGRMIYTTFESELTYSFLPLPLLPTRLVQERQDYLKCVLTAVAVVLQGKCSVNDFFYIRVNCVVETLHVP